VRIGLVNAPNMEATHWVEINVQNQMPTKHGARKEPSFVHHVTHKSHHNNMEQIFILLAISTNMFKI
jgi:hypothetical protein